MNKARMGSTLDSLFEQTGELEEVRLLAQKKVIADQIREAMRRRKVSKSEMAKRMKTSRSAVDRLISPEKPGLTLDSLERASAALDFGLVVQLVPKRKPSVQSRKPAIQATKQRKAKHPVRAVRT